MPPRRAAAASASAAKRAAEVISDNEDDNAKRHKVAGASMAAAAAPAGAAPPAAAAAASSSAAAAAQGFASKGSHDDAALVAAAAAVPLPESMDCSICHESFPAEDECKDEGGVDRIPRSLFCSPKPHTYCTDCLRRMVKRDEDDDGNLCVLICCPECTYKHVLRAARAPSAADAAAEDAGQDADADFDAAELVRRIPINASLMEAVARCRQWEKRDQQLQSRHAAVGCSFPGCAASAVHWCDDCAAQMCAAHDSSWHSSPARSSHRRTLLADRAAARQQRMATALTAEAERIRASARAALQQREQSVRSKHSAVAVARAEQQRAEERLRLEQQRQMAQLQTKYSQRLQLAEAALAKEQEHLPRLRDLTSRLEGMGDADAMAQEATLVALLAGQSNQVASVAAARFSEPAAAASSASAAVVPLPAAAAPPAVVSMRPVAASGLLGRDELSDDLCSHLQRFLGADVRLSDAQLLYRALHDGFSAKDLWSCCAGKGPTLTLVKVARNGFICGAYTPVAWPADAGSRRNDVDDPSGRTFLFSLVNRHGRAVKLRLKAGHHGHALLLLGGRGPGFGGGADLRLMCEDGRPANTAEGCQVAPYSFELDHWSEKAAGLPPIPFAYGRTLLAGDDGKKISFVQFAAAEIEVYQL